MIADMSWNRLHRPGYVAAYVMSLALLGGCATNGKLPPNDPRVQHANRAMAMFQERCKTAGEKVFRKASDVESVFLVKLRPNRDVDTKGAIDPYGRDLDGDGYIETFVRGSFDLMRPRIKEPGSPLRIGYRRVEAISEIDGVRYQYAGRLEEPWQVNKSYSKGYLRFVLDRSPAEISSARYGVTYDDITTEIERDHWIAGSSLRVIDLQTTEVMAERIGYMVDPGQGITAGGRSPWLMAADYACPSFHRFTSDKKSRGASLQSRQTLDFVEKVLTPKDD